MKGVLSFHPVDPDFFDATIEPLVLGEKIDPDAYVAAALRNLVSSWEVARYKRTLDYLLAQVDPPPPPDDGTLWDKLRSRLERFDHKPSRLVRLIDAKIDPDLHLFGRPYLITERSAESVASTTEQFMQAENDAAAQSLIREQLVLLDPEIASGVELDEFVEAPAPAPAGYRSDLLSELKRIYDMARAAQDGRNTTARAVLARELPWRAVYLHSRAVPFWVAQDVDGLDGLCRAADVEPPTFLVPAGRLFLRSSQAYPEVAEHLGVDVQDEPSLGGFVAPQDIPDLLAFLTENGARIIQAGSRHGVAATCKTLLRKIRECACFAERAGVGYLEAAGIQPVGPAFEESGTAG